MWLLSSSAGRGTTSNLVELSETWRGQVSQFKTSTQSGSLPGRGEGDEGQGACIPGKESQWRPFPPAAMSPSPSPPATGACGARSHLQGLL